MASNPLQAQATHHAKCNVTLALIAFIVFFIAAFFDSPAFASYQYDDPGYEYGVGWDADTGTGSGAVTTEGVTDLEVTADFGCNADGSTNGVLFMNPQCDASRGAFGVFANVVCRVENIFGAILGLVYCSVSNAILDPLLALFTLYVTLYGALVILGMVPHKFSEAMVRVAKIGAVAAVALNADVAIGVGYTFFISLTQQFISIVFDIFTPDYIEANSALADMIQAGYQASPTNPDESARLYIGNDWMQNLDYTTHRIIGFFMNGGVGFTTVMVMLFLFAPPLFFLIVYLIFAILKAFATAIVGYLMALLGITFLFTLAPLFVSFALFRATSGWFEAWLRHLFCYALQIMIVFMYLMMMVMLDIVGFFQQVGTMVRSYGEVYFFGWLIFPKTIFTLCRPERSGPEGMSGDLLYFLNTIDGTPGNQPGNQYEGFPRCIEEYDLAAILQGTASKYPANLDQGQMEILRDAMDAVSADPTILLPGEDFLRGHEAVAAIVEKANNDLILPFTEMITTTDLIFFLMVRFIVLIALTFLLEQFMRKIPHTAARLAGVNYAGRLAGGEVGPQDMPGAQKGDAFDGVNVGLARFRKTAFGEGNYPRGFIRSAPRRFRDGVVAGVTGGMKHNVSKTIRDSGDLGINRNMRMETKRDANYMEQVRMGNIRPNSLDAKQTGRTTRKGSDRR